MKSQNNSVVDDPTGGDIPPEHVDPDENAGAQMFFSQVIDLFNLGHKEIVIDYAKKTGEKGKIKMTLTEVTE